MTSKNGTNWTRHRKQDRTSRLFMSPGETRAPCLTRSTVCGTCTTLATSIMTSQRKEPDSSSEHRVTWSSGHIGSLFIVIRNTGHPVRTRVPLRHVP